MNNNSASFEMAMVNAGYRRPIRGDGSDSQYLYERDQDRYVGWQLATAAININESPAAMVPVMSLPSVSTLNEHEKKRLTEFAERYIQQQSKSIGKAPTTICHEKLIGIALETLNAPVATDSQRIEPMEPRRDEGGWWEHPDYIPDLEEGALRVEFDVWLEVNGVVCVARLMEDDLEPGSPEAIAWENLDCDCSAWKPKSPGHGWFLVSIHDTEDGPSAVWLRKLPDAQPTTPYDALLRYYRALFDEHAKLAHEAKGLRRRLEWANDRLTRCTCPSGDGSLRWPCPAHPPVAASVPDELQKIANHIAGSTGGLPDEWQDWAAEIATDIRRAAMLAKQGTIQQLAKLVRNEIYARAQTSGYGVLTQGILDQLDALIANGDKGASNE